MSKKRNTFNPAFCKYKDPENIKESEKYNKFTLFICPCCIIITYRNW